MKLKSIQTRSLTSGTMMLLAALTSSSVLAQSNAKDTTMNRTVVVEQQYNPDIMDAQKVNVLPEIREFITTPNQVEYDRNVAPASALSGSTIPAYTGEEKQDLAKQGYLRLGYGNIGNVDIRGNYLFNLTPKDKLNLSLGMQGWNGEVYYPTEGKDWDTHFYRTIAGIDYSHRFKTVDFNAAGNFGLSNFSYLSGGQMGEITYLPADKTAQQRFTSGDVRFGIQSTDQPLPIRFSGETGLYLFQRGHMLFEPFPDIAVNETKVRTKGNFEGNITTDKQQVGVAFEMNNIFYNNDFYEDYTTLLLRPYYILTDEDTWKLHLGMNTDLAFGQDKMFRISPDVRMSYTISDRHVLYANATGGRILNDFRRFEQLNPYGVTGLNKHESSYELLNTSLGFKMSPTTGLWLDLFAGYQIIKDDLFDVHNMLICSPPTDRPIDSDDITYYFFPNFFQTDIKNFNAGLQANYTYKDVFDIMAKGQYYKWEADNEDALLFKPEYRFDFQINLRPIQALNVNLAYEFVRRRCILDFEHFTIRQPNLSNLNVGATYHLFDSISIYARISNVLNRKAAYYLNSPVPGINFLGGMIFSF